MLTKILLITLECGEISLIRRKEWYRSPQTLYKGSKDLQWLEFIIRGNDDNVVESVMNWKTLPERYPEKFGQMCLKNI